MIKEGDEINSLIENRTDIYYQALTTYSQNLEEEYKFLEISKTAYQIEDSIGQILNEPNNSKTDLSSFLIENWNLVSYILIGYLLLFFFSYIFAKKTISFSQSIEEIKTSFI